MSSAKLPLLNAIAAGFWTVWLFSLLSGYVLYMLLTANSEGMLLGISFDRFAGSLIVACLYGSVCFGLCLLFIGKLGWSQGWSWLLALVFFIPLAAIALGLDGYRVPFNIIIFYSGLFTIALSPILARQVNYMWQLSLSEKYNLKWHVYLISYFLYFSFIWISFQWIFPWPSIYSFSEIPIHGFSENFDPQVVEHRWVRPVVCLLFSNGIAFFVTRSILNFTGFRLHVATTLLFSVAFIILSTCWLVLFPSYRIAINRLGSDGEIFSTGAMLIAWFLGYLPWTFAAHMTRQMQDPNRFKEVF